MMVSIPKNIIEFVEIKKKLEPSGCMKQKKEERVTLTASTPCMHPVRIVTISLLAMTEE